MRASKFSSGNSGCHLCFVAFAVIVVIVLAVPRSWFYDVNFSTPSEDFFGISTSTRMKKGDGYPAVIAYWISGSNRDGNRMLRLLKAIYHPRNQYLLQLDADATEQERADLLSTIQSEKVFEAFGNVNVVGKNYAVNQMGPSAVGAILHAAALLLKLSADWDWFINLSVSDYPLVTQDDLLYAMTSLPRNLNFISFSSDRKWKESHRSDQIVFDPSLYLKKRNDLLYTVETRPTPDAFKLFGGSPWIILTRELMEFCVHSWDNLPRKLLMYFTNTAYPLEFYFHTVICNAPEFQNTTINTDLRYNLLEYDNIMASETAAAFARSFKASDESMMNRIDANILNRLHNGFVPGRWCLKQSENRSSEIVNDEKDLCLTWGDVDTVQPGPYGIKLGVLLSKLVNDTSIRTDQCH